ncbi:hypothetical protein SK571_15430 [Lentzea sp. BCCO 10_0798]|jgi:hypothetical protein|uniref:Secreted protein n=1 Tax=Lentzea kristufekii TaxID=3095430 RepID=A0ABU4TR55_9PSEU|nr:hypothetical protein [Lentzea sp. BCCO 10_0798]MDX8050780.1 hypothetical protein [Lentzea sp. BCCO 10_0798]
MSRQPDRSRSRRIVLAVVLFAFIISPTGDDKCEKSSPAEVTGVLAAAALLPRLIGTAGRALVLISHPSRAVRPPCTAK